jgi:hypothetical protein
MTSLPLHFDVPDLPGPARRAYIFERALELMPLLLLLAALLLFIAGFELGHLLKWKLPTRLSFVGLALLEVIFVQLMVLVALSRSLRIWLSAWFIYLFVLTIFAEACFLAPITASLFVVAVFVKSKIERPRIFSKKSAQAALKGLAALPIALLFWGDKFLLLLKHGGPRGLEFIFLGLIPSLLLSNVFYTKISPRLGALLSALQLSMCRDSLPDFQTFKTHVLLKARKILTHLFFIATSLTVLALVILRYLPWVTDQTLLVISVAAILESLSSSLAMLHFSIGSCSAALTAAAAHVAFLVIYSVLIGTKGAGDFGALSDLSGLEALECLLQIFLIAFLFRSLIKRWAAFEYHTVWKRVFAI